MESSHTLLTNRDCSKILKNCFKRDELKVVSHSVTSLSERIEGFLGQHFFVTIDYTDHQGLKKSHRYFMKVLNGASKLMFEISQALNAYNKEEFFYTFLLKEFESYNIDVLFAPKGYFCKPQLLILEDVSQRGFRNLLNRSQFLDLEHCKIGLATLSKLHSASLLFDIYKNFDRKSQYDLKQEHTEMFEDILSNGNNIVQEWFTSSLKGISDLIPVISESHNIDKEKCIELLERILFSIKNNTDYLNKFKGTVLHGDAWYNNFMFKYENEVPIDSILIDYQLLTHGPPSIDVLHFIYANTRKNLRDDYFEDLIEFYYEKLNSALPKKDLYSILPKDQYLQLCDELQLMVKLHCVCDRSVTLLVDDMGPEITDEETLKVNLIDKRSEKILECFDSNDFFREVMTEDIVELCHMLIKSQHLPLYK